MNATLNDHPAYVVPDHLESLASRLTDPGDREAYAAILSYVQALPPTDEFRQVAELFGLLSVLGQHIPDALAELLIELRSQTSEAAEYHERLEGRLASLPQDLAAGVDAGAIAKAMSESFRQQIAATGLQETAALLEGSVKGIKDTTSEVLSTLKLYRGVAASLSSELAKLVNRSRLLCYRATWTSLLCRAPKRIRPLSISTEMKYYNPSHPLLVMG